MLTALSLRHAILRSIKLMAQTSKVLKTRKKACRIKVVAMHKIARNVEKTAGVNLTNGPQPQARELHQEKEDRKPHGPDSLPGDPLVDSKLTRPDPTRYGDWELKGRCIDF
jgi:uncharacterized ubiquitin-like protein YukD